MNIKKYIADSAQEALQLVKKDMGQEAVILRTRTLPVPGKYPGEADHKIEVTAAVDYDSGQLTLSEVDKTLVFASDLLRWQRVERELRAVKEAIFGAEAKALFESKGVCDTTLRTRYMNFKNFGLRSEVIRELMQECPENGKNEVPSSTVILQHSLTAVLNRIRMNSHNDRSRGRKIYSFIGPTGVGKTTTLAKLAALNAVKQGKKVALMTLDTFRVGAVAQLEAYARIMGIPLNVLMSPSEFQEALRLHSDCDFIFIDTAGRSPNENQDIIQLKNFFTVPDVMHHYLVLSATTEYQNLIDADRRFADLPFRSYIFTKLDEAQDASSMVNFLISRQKPVSYFTTGQQVPDDIESVSRKKLASMILAGMREIKENRQMR
jgi:flagellar biosynthesis protein FlhF